MAFIALDVGGTKIAGALFINGEPVDRNADVVSGKKGREFSGIMLNQIKSFLKLAESRSRAVKGIGVCVPGIYDPVEGTVWAPNIPRWESYPLLKEITEATGHRIPVHIDSDRSCYILGEVWKGNAEGC